MLVIRRCA